MSRLDETAMDEPVRDLTGTLSQHAAAPDSSMQENVRAWQDVSQVSREELEDRFLRLHDESLLLKQHIHEQDEKIKKLATKLMKLVKDRGRMEQLASGRQPPAPRMRDLEMEEKMEELQEEVRSLQGEKEQLKQRLLVAKHQLINTQSRRPTPYDHVQARVNAGWDDTPSPLQRRLAGSRRPITGQLPRYGHSLLGEARAKIRDQENTIVSLRSHIEEVEGTSELLREDLRRKKDEYEERLQQVQEEHVSKLRSCVVSNVTKIKLQKQLAERSDAVAALEGRFLQMQESQRILKVSHQAALAKVDELSAQLKDERLKTRELETRLQHWNGARGGAMELQEQMRDMEQERNQLKEDYENLLNSVSDVSQQQQQKWMVQEQQLKFQISQLETALKADLQDKNEILDRVKAQTEANEKLTEENQKLRVQFLEQKQQLEEHNHRSQFYSREDQYSVEELTEALLLVQMRKQQQDSELSFLAEAQDGVNNDAKCAIGELRAAHAETVLELEKTRHLLDIQGKISQDYKAELDAVLQKIDADKAEWKQKLEHQTQLLDMKVTKIKKLEARLRDVAYGSKAEVFAVDVAGQDEADETPHLQVGENLLELQIVGAALSPSALEALGDRQPCTFCTYSFYLFDLHSTPVVTGPQPEFRFTSEYMVSMDHHFLDYLHRHYVTVELHQALGLDWRTVARGRLQLQQLLQQDGRVHGSIPLIATDAMWRSDEVQSFGSLDYWMRLRIPFPETICRYQDKLKAAACTDPDLTRDRQHPPASSSWNELHVTVQRCTDLRSRSALQPSPYVVYRFFDFGDYPTATADDCCDPQFNDLKVYSVRMDTDVDEYLRSDLLQFYVFDYKEEQMDVYLGRAALPLRSLACGEAVKGMFELSDQSGHPAGHIEVSLSWKFTYLPHPGSAMPIENTAMMKEGVDQGREEKMGVEEEAKDPHLSDFVSDVTPTKALLPRIHKKIPARDGPAAKKVTFVDATAADHSVACGAAGRAAIVKESSQFLEELLVPASPQSDPDDSEISEDSRDDVEAVLVSRRDSSESTQSDSDDCIVQGRAGGRKASDRLRVEVVSLSLRPESRVSRDCNVVRLFVEYSFLDLPIEETPLSLPKPSPGTSINYNYSRVIPVDGETNGARRRLLREVLQGRNPPMERIRFTVVSEPPMEEEQERECEDVGVAYLRIPEILEKQQDLTEAHLDVVDVEDGGDVVGHLTVSLDGLEALQTIMDELDSE
ncbi:protein fantom [Aulostomus maculatus]